MKILVDADACPVKEIIEKIAKNNGISVIMFCDTAHIIASEFSKVVTVDKGSNSADIVLANNIQKNDIVVTQDFGVAAMALGKGAYSINQNGYIFTDENIEKLLFERFISSKVRRSGKRVKGPVKRKKEDDEKFENNFSLLIKKAVENEKN